MQPTAPWHVATETDGEATDYIVEDDCHRRIATPWDGTNYRTAALIAAAPDLLAALRHLLCNVEDVVDFGLPFEHPDNNFHASVTEARAAIRKATEGDQ